MSLASRTVLARARPSILGQQKRHITIQELDEARDGRERVVVLGSGWAGYTLARDLDSRKFQPVIVSPRSYFVFTPLLASTSVGTLEFRTALEPVRRRNATAAFFQGWGDAVDFEHKVLRVEEAVEDPLQGRALVADRHEGRARSEFEEQKAKGKVFAMRYDKLVIAVGCYAQTFGTPGVKEHAYFLKDVGDARRIRNRMLSCFESAALPTTTEAVKRRLLNFAVVGGGPTGIEWAAEAHDIVREDMSKFYPELVKYFKITVYDVAPKVLSMFDEKLADYAMQTFRREGIVIKTSHHVKSLRPGAPGEVEKEGGVKDSETIYTLDTEEEGEVGCGLVVWSTGLMANPFVEKALDGRVKKHEKSGSLLTNGRLQAKRPGTEGRVVDDVFALGDCAIEEGTMYPATAQVANQKATWLAKRLNKGDLDGSQGFSYKDLGVMAYVGNWNAILQSSGAGDISGRVAWFIWRGAYLAKSVSWRNRILIPVYCVITYSNLKRPFECSIGKGSISLGVNVRAHPSFTDCYSVDGTIVIYKFQKGRLSGICNHVGTIKAVLINKSEAKTFKQEFLGEYVEGIEANETREMMKAVYTANGARRPKMAPFADALKTDRFLHLDTLLIRERFRGCGFGAIVLDMFHEIMPTLKEDMAFRGTVLLSPACILDEDYGGKSKYDVETKLIEFYTKCGYTLMQRGDRYKEGKEFSISVMSRSI
ncbi:putative pyridine nucleotide-disulfide oxidoreductase protein [Teratosphaeria destructans]|uniref:Pyridine nucleotide-disulfide oxidoreductase protein n=1 Tax=Teratosphaeria destructans TaxID=418781 RepID=A0A9W7W295_9PEZI|nr:putative pyridine nucleotide-disulfide oxidoreductase protein [Teratosphaeria destructans]